MDPYQHMTEEELRAARKLKPTDPLTWCRISDNFKVTGNDHVHYYFQLYYMRRGSARFFVEGHSLSLTRGDCVIVTPDEVHRIVLENGASFRTISFYMQVFPPMFLDEPCLQRFFSSIMSNSMPHKINLSDTELLYVDQLATYMNDEDEKEQEGYKNVLLCILTSILTILSRAFFHEQKQSKHNSAMLDTLEYINTHFQEPISGADLARRMFLSESTFYRVFKRMTGHYFKDYLTSTRIRNACRLLREKKLPLAAIAAECGYGDYSVFYRAFVQTMQMPPSTYQQRDLPVEISHSDD